MLKKVLFRSLVVFVICFWFFQSIGDSMEVFGQNTTQPVDTVSYELQSISEDKNGQADFEETPDEMNDILDSGVKVLSGALFFNGEGTAQQPYLIENSNDLLNLSNIVREGYETEGKYFLLSEHIYIDSVIYPIGTSVNPFKGVFYAHADAPKTIYNLKINGYEDNTALFAYLSSARIENINLADVQVTGTNFTAGIAGYAVSSQIINCSVSGKISGAYAVGGVAAIAENSKIINSASFADIEGETMLGGVASFLTGANTEIYGTFFFGNITAVLGYDDSIAGGFAAYMSGGLINECYSYAVIKSNGSVNEIGGFISTIDEGAIKNTYASGTINADYASGFIYRASGGSVINCYSSVRISGNQFYSGFVSVGEHNVNFENCFFNEEINSDYISINNVEGINGITTYQMTEGSRDSMTGFEDSLWYFYANSGNSKYYPQLLVFQQSQYSNHSNKSAEAGMYYSVRFVIPFDMETEDWQLVNQLVIPGESCYAPSLRGPDADMHIGWAITEGAVAQYQTNRIDSVNENLVLYPVFSVRETFRVIYYAQDADSGRPPEDLNFYAVGDYAVIKGNEGNLFKAGYEFNGWQDQNGIQYSPGDSVLIVSSLRLSPVWRKSDTESGGNSPGSVNYFYGNSYELPDPFESLFRFADLFKMFSELNIAPPDNKINVDSEVYFKQAQGIFEDYIEILLKFTLELPLELLK